MSGGCGSSGFCNQRSATYHGGGAAVSLVVVVFLVDSVRKRGVGASGVFLPRQWAIGDRRPRPLLRILKLKIVNQLFKTMD